MATVLFLALAALAGPRAGDSPAGWKAGAASVNITPRKSMWMTGYGMRRKPSQGTLQDLHAKALALEDPTGRRAVLVSSDLLGFPAAMAALIAREAEKRWRLERDRLLLNSSHSHCTPALASPIRFIYGPRSGPEDWKVVEEYTAWLEQEIVALIGAALEDLKPARLSFARSEAGFGVNRRKMTGKGIVSFVENPAGPADPDVPVLRVEGPAGALRAIVFGYAAHPTTIQDKPPLGGTEGGGPAELYRFNGDYAGYARERLEADHPGAVALFIQGCGGDIMVSGRGTVERAKRCGEELAAAVERALAGPQRTLEGPLRTGLEVFPLEFAPPPRREELEARLKHEDPYFRWHAQEMLKVLDRDGRLPASYPYPLQVWRFGGELTLLALAGEVVVDYSLRLKKELGPSSGFSERLWVAGYSNDVFAYIPSRKVLEEGGYEGGEAMIYYVQPGRFAPAVEETIIRKARELVERLEGDRRRP